MSPRKLANFRIDQNILDALKAIKERDGMPLTEQVKRALLAWAKAKRMKVAEPTNEPSKKKTGAI